MTQDKVLDKLAKIKAMAESAKAIGNEKEAQAFAGMLQQLLLKHKLEMTDIEYAKDMQDEPIIQHTPETEYIVKSDGKPGYARVYKDFPDVEVVRHRREWSEALAGIIADAYSCRIMITIGSSIVHFVGHKSNVAIAEYLYLTMLRSAIKISDKEAKTFRREYRAKFGIGETPAGFRESFLMGFATRISQRLKEERRKFETPTTNTALVRVNKEALAVKNYMGEKFGDKKAKALGGNKDFNRDGYEKGKEVANSMNISGNAVNAGSPNKQLS